VSGWSGPKLGELVEGERERDAVHVAVIPVVAGAHLQPGQRVRLVDGRALPVPTGATGVGVVDPFLTFDNVRHGERFWLLLYPGTITSLRHEWAHPAFPRVSDGEGKDSAERWLKTFAAENDIGFRTLVDACLEGGYHSLGHNETASQQMSESLSNPLVAELLWRHMEVYTGQRFAPDHRDGTYFGCAC
jgi:hypothetical protein